MRPPLLAIGLASLLVTASAPAPQHGPDPRTSGSRGITFSPGSGQARTIEISGAGLLRSQGARTDRMVTEISSDDGRLLASLRAAPNTVRILDGRGLAATAQATAPRATNAEATSTLIWKDADGSTTVIAAFDGAPIELSMSDGVEPRAESQNLDFAIHAIGPNPFASGTTFRFALPEAGRVTLAVFDPAGRRVAKLLDQRHEAGLHTAQWRPGHLPAGRYYARLTFTGASRSTERTTSCSVVKL